MGGWVPGSSLWVAVDVAAWCSVLLLPASRPLQCWTERGVVGSLGRGRGVVSVGGLVVVSWRGCCFVDVVRGFDFRPPAVLAHEIFTGRLERFSSAYKRALPPVPDIACGIVDT